MSIASERKALERTYTDECDVLCFETVKNGSVTEKQLILQYSCVKCALSQKSLKTAQQTERENAVEYDAKLFVAPEYEIAPGSHVVVRRLGREMKFISSGEAFVYETHQEILLRRNDKA